MIEMTLPVVLQIIQTAALIVGIVYYLTIMRNQQKAQKTAEETRKIQLLMQVYQSQDVDYSQRRRDVAELEFDDYDDFSEKVDRLTWSKVMITIMEWNQLGLLLKYGFVDSGMMFEFLHGRGPIIHWNKYEPIVMEYRKNRRWFSFGVGMEYLAAEMEKYRDTQEQMLLKSGNL